MKKRNAYLISFFSIVLLFFSACSSNDNENVDYTGELGQIKFDLRFEGAANASVSAGTRANSSAIPITSWSDIKQVQFFLYNASGLVRYSVTETPTSNATYTYTDVPTGTYTLVAVANAKSSINAVETKEPALGTVEWNNFNVRSKDVLGFKICHKPTTFPAYANPAGNTAYTMPAEVFMAEATGVEVSSGIIATVSVMKLKREVSLMRIRLNVMDTEAGTNNTSTGDNGVDWTQNASVLIYNLPDYIGISAGNAGGASATSTSTNIMVAASGAATFKTTDPASTVYDPTTILGGNFTMWNDIVVFPNNGGRLKDDTAGDNAAPAQQYFIVLSAQGKAGHKLADGTTMSADGPVYWSGLIKGNFERNYIREVNLTLKSGGTTTIPTVPTEEGELTINLGEPAPWNSTIQEESIIL